MLAANKNDPLALIVQQGQEHEFGTPQAIMTPVKSKRYLKNFESPASSSALDKGARGDSVVHLVPQKRFDTWAQAAAVIDLLARTHGLPQEALSDRRQVN